MLDTVLNTSLTLARWNPSSPSTHWILSQELTFHFWRKTKHWNIMFSVQKREERREKYYWNVNRNHFHPLRILNINTFGNLIKTILHRWVITKIIFQLHMKLQPTYPTSLEQKSISCTNWKSKLLKIQNTRTHWQGTRYTLNIFSTVGWQETVFS